MFPVKYIENNIVMNQERECFAYYEMIPYNYSFLSVDQKNLIHDEFRQFVASNKSGSLHFLMIAAESSIRQRQERSKECVRGSKNVRTNACAFIDSQTEVLVADAIEQAGRQVKEDKKMLDGSQIDYRFFIGIKLISAGEEMNFQKLKEKLRMTFSDFLLDVNHRIGGDFASVDNREMGRYLRMEKNLLKRIRRRFRFQRMTEKDFGYLVERLYGQVEVPYYKYDYCLPKEKLEQETLIKVYDLLKLTRCLNEEHQRYIKSLRGKEVVYAAYLTIDTIMGEVAFPYSELCYYQQEYIDFPVDLSMNVEIVTNKTALSFVRNKKKEMADLDRNAREGGADVDNTVGEGMLAAEELEDELISTKDALYKVSYVLRVSAQDLETLEDRVDALMEFYRDKNIRLVRPFGDMLGLSGEFVPASKRYINDYIQYVTADFFAGLGFGAAQILGEEYGEYVGINTATGRHVYIQPALAAQGVSGSVTNALSKIILGDLGTGKSMAVKQLITLTAIYGGKVLYVDPKSECGNLKEDLKRLGKKIDIVELAADEAGRGMLDPFVIMRDVEDAKRLALDILTYLTGISLNDGDRFPELFEAVDRVAKMQRRGLWLVTKELRNAGNKTAEKIARHIEGFANYSFAQLLFSDGNVERSISCAGDINIVQIQNLILPQKETLPENYTATERLSIAAMMAISTFALDFIHSDKTVFKEVVIDEAWSLLGVAQGKELIRRLIREGRSMNSAVDIVTQNANDIDENMKNNIGLKFAFRSTDKKEVKDILKFFGLELEAVGNQKAIENLNNGECLFQDLYGRMGIIYLDVVHGWLFQAFDTRPPEQEAEGSVTG